MSSWLVTLVLSVQIYLCYKGILFNPFIVINRVVQTHSLSSVVVNLLILADDNQ